MFPLLERNLTVGLKSLWHRKLRSFLTVLGVIFGVASVIAMLAIGEGASYEAQQRLKELGSSNIILRSVKPPSSAEETAQISRQMAVNRYGLLKKDLKHLAIIPSIQTIVPVYRFRENIWHLAHSVSGQIVATEPTYKEVTNLPLAGGRFFNDIDLTERKNVAVLGGTLAKKFFPFGDALGQTVRVKQHYYRVVGVLQERALSGGGATLTAEDVNNNLYLPLSTVQNHFGEFIFKQEAGNVQREWVELHEIIAKTSEERYVVPTATLIAGILKQNHKKPDYEIFVPLELLKQAEQTKRLFNIVLGSIAAISLLVGGIGIMNIMLASVMERTREIGIRRAIGAKKRDIIIQFLVETTILSLGGGVLGVALGVIIPTLVTRFAGMKTIVTLWSVVLAFSISAAIGIIFGLYPARQAAEMDPITALRHE